MCAARETCWGSSASPARPCCLHSARSASDVVIYSFPASDFEDLVLKYPYARQFVEAHDTVTADYQWATDTRDPQQVFLHDVVGRKALESCSAQMSIRDVAQSMLTTGSDAIAVVDEDDRVQAVVTVNAVLAWVAGGAGQRRPADHRPAAGRCRPRSGRPRRSSTACWRSPTPTPTRWP